MTQDQHGDHAHDDGGHGDHPPNSEPNLALLGKALPLIGVIGFTLSQTLFHHDTSLLSFVFNPIAMIALFIIGVLTYAAKSCCCQPKSAEDH